MPNTYVDIIKKDAVVQVPVTNRDIVALQSILLRSIEHKISLDDSSWETIENLCARIDECAKEQNLTESRIIEF